MGPEAGEEERYASTQRKDLGSGRLGLRRRVCIPAVVQLKSSRPQRIVHTNFPGLQGHVAGRSAGSALHTNSAEVSIPLAQRESSAVLDTPT